MPEENQVDARTVKEFFDGYVRFYSTMHGAARAYTNLITAVGYAGLFGIWSLTREHLAPRLALWTAVFLLISLSSFALFEVFKTFLVNRSINQRAQVLFHPEDSLETRVAKLQRFESENAMEESRFNKLWLGAWLVAVVFGILAILVLLFSLFCSLVNLP
jgi:hypothetical protein